MTTEKRNRTAIVLLFSLLVTSVGLNIALNARDRKSAAEARLYKKAIDTANTAVVVLDRNGVVENWSFGATRLFGWTGEYAIGKKVTFLLPLAMQEAHDTAFERAIEANRTDLIQVIECSANHAVHGEGALDVVVNTRTLKLDGTIKAMAVINRQSDVKKIRLSLATKGQ